MKNFGGGGPVVIGGENLPSPVGIGLTDPPNIGGAPGSGITGTFLRDPTSPKKDCTDLENVMQKCIREISKFANV